MRIRALPLTVLVLLTACQAAPGEQAGATLRVDVVGSANDPAAAPRRTVMAATQAGLTGLDSAGRTIPGLASSWRIASDGRSVIFRLRAVLWADGRKLVASDIVTAFRRLVAPATVNALKPAMAVIENAAEISVGHAAPAKLGVDAPLDGVVEIRLPAPAPSLLALLAQPELAVVRTGSTAGTLGAFAAGDLAAQPIVLQRNPAYYAASTVALSGIELMPDEDPGVGVARFAHDRTDLVIGSGLAGLSDARLLGPQVLHVEPSWGVYGYLANTRSGPLADARVRRALSMVINRDGLGARLFGINALLPVNGMLPPGLAGSTAETLPDWAMLAPPERIAAARALLAAAGYDAAHPLALTVSLPPGREHAGVLAAVAGDWAAVGVATTARALTASEFAVALRRGDFELALSERVTAVDAPAFFLDSFRCHASPGGYCNAAVDTLLGSTATDAAATANAEAILSAEAPLIPLFRPVRWALVQPRVTGWVDNIAGSHPLDRLGVMPRRAAR